MFKQRLVTILCLAPLVILFIYYANHWIFTSLVLLVVLGCALEWLALIPLKSTVKQVIFVIFTLMLTILIQYSFHYWLVLSLGLWILILFAVLGFPHLQKIWGHSWVVTCLGLVVIPVFAQSMLQIHSLPQGKILVLYLLCLIWAADVGAYVIGKQIGRHKLIAAVSPGKTVEGSLGGMLLSLLVALLAWTYFKLAICAWLLLAIATALISILGDLFISVLKRRAKIKDTGKILPGHGGVLDRLDSLIAAAPLFYYGLHIALL